MILFLFGLTLGIIGGFFLGLWVYAKHVHKNIEIKQVSRATINSIIKGEDPKGEFIKVNKVEQILKDHSGDISLGDIIEDTNEI